MEGQFLWAKIADLNGVLVALERGRSGWGEFAAELQKVIGWLWDQEASALRDDVVEDLQRTAEHARHRKHGPARESLRDAAAHFA